MLKFQKAMVRQRVILQEKGKSVGETGTRLVNRLKIMRLKFMGDSVIEMNF